MHGSKVHNSSFQRKWRSLHWFTPKGSIPHGFCGLVASITGYGMLFQALLIGPDRPYGIDIHGPTPKFLYYVFLASLVLCALGGLMLRKNAIKEYQAPFIMAGIGQIALCWFGFRLGRDETRIYSLWASMMDKACALFLIFASLSFPALGWRLVPFHMYIVLCLCFVALNTTLFHPYQLAYWGTPWFECLTDKYPWQVSTMASYIFIPTCLNFAQVIFGATLYIRKIVDSVWFGIIYFPLVISFQIVAILLMEYYATQVSTQKFIVVCHDSPSEFDLWIERKLDVSQMVIDFFASIDVPLQPPPARGNF